MILYHAYPTCPNKKRRILASCCIYLYPPWQQSFTPEQTSAFHGIARKVFEAGIERGELDLEGAFQAFTDMVLALAVVVEGDTPTTESTLNPAPGLACGGSDDGAPGR